MKNKLLVTLSLLIVPFIVFSGDEVYETSSDDYYEGVENCGYLFAYGGLAFGYDLDDNDPLAANLHFAFEDGYIVGGGIGHYSNWFNGSRFEIEGLHAKNDLDFTADDFGVWNQYLNVPPLGHTQSGDVSVTAVMFNLLKELYFGEVATAYIGGGIGYANVQFDNTVNITQFGAPLFSQDLSLSQGTFAYQAIAGVDFWVNDRWSIFTQYKLLGLDGFDMEVTGGNAFLFDTAYQHSVSAGLRFSF